MAVRRSRGVSRGTARKKVWTRSFIGQTTLAAAAGSYSLPLASFETDYGAQLLGVTVARIRAQLWIQAPNGRNGYLYGFRIATADTVADLAPAPAQAPGTMPNADWMAYGLAHAGAQGGLDNLVDVDVRSMRKLDELNQTLLLAVENVGADALTWGGHVSVLVLLP